LAFSSRDCSLSDINTVYTARPQALTTCFGCFGQRTKRSLIVTSNCLSSNG
jgi:hypothetical protein